MTQAVLGIDPGTRKVGFAVVSDATSPPLTLGIERLERFGERLRALAAEHRLGAVALGGGTNADAVKAVVANLGVPIHLIDESNSTYKARALYFADHPPRGWKRLVPLGLQVPARPIDDYAALVIARRYAERGFDLPLP